MEKKKTLLMLAFVLIFIFSFGCAAKVNVNEVRSYSDSITENLLIAMNNGDYEMFSANLSPTMKKAIPQSEFPKLIEQIEGKIGKYIPNSKQFKRAYASGGFVNVIYEAKFTNENSPVTIRVVFKEINGKHEVTGLWFNSPKLAKK